MTEFVNWNTLATYGGALAMVLLLTQYTKGIIDKYKKIPTQLWSYILSLIVLLCAYAFTSGLNWDTAFQAIFNAVIISVASNGGHAAIKKITDSGTGQSNSQ